MKKYLFIIYIISIQTFSQNVEMTYNVNQIDEKFVANENQKMKLLVNSLNNHSDFTVYTEKANDSIFSIYIQNNTNDSINLSTQDWHLYLIQEAKNENNKWQPIEYWRYSWCGNSFLSRKVKAKEIIRTETVAYNGNFETEIRFKFLNNSKVYYSNILKGKISKEQFVLTDSIKNLTGYNQKFTGGKTTSKMIFLEPDGLKEFAEKSKKRKKWIMRKNRKLIKKNLKEDQKS